MASTQFSGRTGASDRAPDELVIVLNSKLAEECEEHRALTKKLMDHSCMLIQSQLDDMRRTFQEMFVEHSKTTERLMEEQRMASEQRLQGVLQTCQKLEGQLEQTVAEERAAVQSALQSVAEALQRERAQRRAEMQHFARSLRDGPRGDGPPDARRDDDPAQRSATLEAAGSAAEPGASHLAGAAEAESPGSSLPSTPRPPATELEERTTPAAIAGAVLRSQRPPLRPSPSDPGSGGPEAPPDKDGGEQVEPAGQLEQPFRPVRAAVEVVAEVSAEVLAEAAEVVNKMVTEVSDPAAVGEVAEEFTFHGSLWDAVIFIGSDEIGHFGSIFTAGALLINAAMQLLMCVIINDNLTVFPVDESAIQQFEYWRTTVAHNIKYVDQFSWQSLARRVCEFKSAPMSSSPISGLGAINSYRPRTADRDFFSSPPLSIMGTWMEDDVGELMCCLALLIWWMTVLQEVYSIVDMAMAIELLPKGTTVFAVVNERYKLEAVSNPRRCLIGAVILLRAGICVLLWVVGTLYLVATVSVGDLILNAVALEIVLNLDELAFSVLAPASACKLIGSMAPLPAGRSKDFRGLDCKPAFSLLFCTVALVIVDTFLLRGHVANLELARDAICDGNLDFIFGVGQTGLVWASDPLTEIEVTSTYPYRAVRHLIENDTAASDSYHADGEWMTANWGQGVSGSYWSVERVVDLPVEKSSGLWNLYCSDMDESETWASDFWRIALEILNDLGAETAISSCGDVADYCDEQEEIGVRARQLCPATCGCDDPTSNLTLVSASQGCPDSCRFSNLYRNKMSDLECADYSPDEPTMINGTDVLAVFLSGLMETEWLPKYGADVEMAIQRGGCAEVLQELRGTWLGDLCREENPEGIRPVTLLCPVSCRCDQSGALLCPPACG